PPRRRSEPGGASRGGSPEPLPLRSAVQGRYRAAPAPVRHRPPRRAGATAPGSWDRLLHGRDRRAGRLLGPEPVRPPLQAPRRRDAGAVPAIRKNRLTGRKPRQEFPQRPAYDAIGSGARGARASRVGRYDMNEDTELDLQFAITELEPRKNPAPIHHFGSGG